MLVPRLWVCRKLSSFEGTIRAVDGRVEVAGCFDTWSKVSAWLLLLKLMSEEQEASVSLDNKFIYFPFTSAWTMKIYAFHWHQQSWLTEEDDYGFSWHCHRLSFPIPKTVLGDKSLENLSLDQIMLKTSSEMRQTSWVPVTWECSLECPLDILLSCKWLPIWQLTCQQSYRTSPSQSHRCLNSWRQVSIDSRGEYEFSLLPE